MDTVTEAQMAIHMALFGGIGIVHYNDRGAVRRDRRRQALQNGHPRPVHRRPPKLSDLDRIKQEHGFSGCPVTSTGKLGGRLVGIVTTRDDFVKDRDTLVSDVMTTEPTAAKEGCTLEANKILRDSKGELLVVNAQHELVATISRKTRKNRDPVASKDEENKKLLVGASVHTPRRQAPRQGLVEAGVDLVVTDSSQGDSTYQKEMVQFIKANHPEVQVVGGNVVCVSQARNLIEWGVDGLRIGMGSGSICRRRR